MVMPYIPEDHKKYNLLPYSVEHGGEVFCYPGVLIDKIESYYPEDTSFIPYGYNSYEEYYAFLREYRDKTTDEELKALFVELENEIAHMNRKEEWSICRYIGNPMSLVMGLTPGQCYYWPCCADNPIYDGVIDNEEFTSYWYATDSELWEIILDPTGMAQKTISNPERKNKKDYFNSMMRSVNGDNWTDI